MNLRDRAFLITGGASGLGAAVARRLMASGARVMIADRAPAAGQALATELGGGARFVETDVADEASVERAVREVQLNLGNLRGVVHCAGIVAAARVLGKNGPHELALFRRVVDVNLVGTFNVVRLAAAAIASCEPEEDGERGVVVTTASAAAFDGQIGQSAYAASKGGVAAMTLPLARDLARHGIRVVAIAPGIFDTPMMAGMPTDVRRSLASQVPFPPRLGDPDEFASLVEHIIANRMLNGEVIRLDGALRMGMQ